MGSANSDSASAEKDKHVTRPVPGRQTKNDDALSTAEESKVSSAG